MTTRPCGCDRFVPRRPYRPDRDCHKCWLFAHRPPVRRAWGGDPAGALPVDVPRPDMPAEALADLFADRPSNLPDGWRLWPATRAAYLLLAERFLAAMPAYPKGQFAGRGAVTCGGGRYEASAYVLCRMLRHVGWPHPVQVWHRGEAEPVSRRVRDLPGVEVVDVTPHAARLNRPVVGGWDAKTLAVLACPFEEVLFLDADCYPVANPDECFDPAHNPHGIGVWPDYPGVQNVHWPTYGIDPDGHPTGVAGGNYVLTKRAAWAVLQLANHYDSHSSYYYRYSWADGAVGGFGDQDQMRAALHKLGAKSTRCPCPGRFFGGHTVVYAGPTGRPLFVHRHGNKFADRGEFPAPPGWHPDDLPMEATAWKYFLEWLTLPADPSAWTEGPVR